MSYKDLPVELAYNIIGRIIAEYIDTAIASPPKPSYLLPHSDEVVSKVQALLTAERKKNGTFIPVTIGSDRTEWTDITPEEFNSALKKLETLDTRTSDAGEVSESGEGGAGATRDDTIENSAQVPPVSDEDITNSENAIDSDSDEEEEEEEEEEELDRDRVTTLFKEWDRDESSEKLPRSAIQPLLGVNRSTRAVTLKVAYDALGLDPAQSDESINLRINRLLHDARKRYRIVCTKPFCLWDDLLPEYNTKPGPEAPLINMYLFVSRYTITMHRFRSMLSVKGLEGRACFKKTIEDIGTLKQMRFPSPILLPYVCRRIKIASKRFKIALKCLQHFCDPDLVISDVMLAYVVPLLNGDITNLSAISSSINIESECRLLKGSVDRLCKFDDENMDRHSYAELPGTIIKSFPILSSLGLRAILMVNEVPGLKDMEDIKYCAKKAEELLRRWQHRYDKCKTDYVVLTLSS